MNMELATSRGDHSSSLSHFLLDNIPRERHLSVIKHVRLVNPARFARSLKLDNADTFDGIPLHFLLL